MHLCPDQAPGDAGDPDVHTKPRATPEFAANQIWHRATRVFAASQIWHLIHN